MPLVARNAYFSWADAIAIRSPMRSGEFRAPVGTVPRFPACGRDVRGTAAKPCRAAYNRRLPDSRRRAIPFGKYELLERINIGGMAEILKAGTLSREDGLVAVKRILPHLTDDRQFVTMFKDESRVLAQLEHENIVRTLEFGEVNETLHRAGVHLGPGRAHAVPPRAPRRAGHAVRLACYIMAQVCSALHYAHELTDTKGDLLGVVHRDISLQNVLISYDGR